MVWIGAPGALLNVQHLDVDEVGRSRPNLETRKVVAGCLRVAETPIRSCARGRSDYRSIPLDGYREHRTIDSGQGQSCPVALPVTSCFPIEV